MAKFEFFFFVFCNFFINFSITNFNEVGVFLYRISGAQPQDRNHGFNTNPSEYEYQHGEEQEYDIDDELGIIYN